MNMETRMYGLTIHDIRSIAYQLAVKNRIPNPFSAKTQLAGKDWFTGFRMRHPEISLRAPEATSTARARAFNRPVVTKFFSLLKSAMDKTPYSPHRIFNVDETSVSTVPGKNCKILAKKGRKQVGRVVSAERGVSTTAVICMSAGGNFVPPMLIFSRQRMKQELKDGAPPGTIFECNG
uniref:HTH CENPB-type domain-containing protein n=1 Tax=Photinus pyralis TaxID=7054 RepID=A0A1Y1LVY9_PHOPY